MVAFNGNTVPATSTISISAGSSSWAADTYTIPNNTNIILDSGVLSFTILAKTLVIGSGVTFTWQPAAAKAVPAQSLGSLQVPAAPPGLPPVYSSAPLDLRGNAQFAGTQGSPGKTGNGGFQGDSGPTLTLIYETLEMQTAHPPTFVLSGQQGQTGGQGGTGGSGGKGPQGTAAQASTIVGTPDGCSRNVGYGGNGGTGGTGGTGGPGGVGGSNGQLAIFSSAANLQQLGVTPVALYGDVGLGGAGGLGGQGGSGGVGGDPGPNDVTFCQTINGRTGNPGQTGATGASGPTASQGTRVVNYQTQLLDSQQVQDCFAAPRITSVSPSVVLPGSLLTLFGSNFAAGQNVTFAGKTLYPSMVTVPMTTQMTIELPTILAGPSATISIGNLSALCQTSQASVLIGLKLTLVQQASVGSVNMPGPGSVLFQPGSVATAHGDGFGPNMTVIINSTILGGAQVTADTTDQSITFTMTRPGSFDKYDASNKWGETVSITVAHQDVAIPSPPPILLKLDTFHLYVLGDSIAWGQGNNEESKHYALLAAWLTKRFNNALGVYVTVLARSGAPFFKSGSGPFTGAVNWPPEAAEIPADRPFITEQAGTLVKDVLAHGSLSTVKLVLLTACANDVDANTFWCLRNGLIADTELACDSEVGNLLDELTQQLPNTLFLVTDYYNALNLPSADVVIQVGLLYHTWFGDFPDAVNFDCNPETFVSNNLLFAQLAHDSLQQQVALRSNLSSGVLFAPNTFDPQANAAYGADPFVYSPLETARTKAYLAANCPMYSPMSGTCTDAFVFHPNEAGSFNYYQAFVKALEVNESQYCGAYCGLLSSP